MEAVDNVTKIHDELIYNYDYSGNYRRAVGKDGIQTFYSFTRNPKHSEKVKKIPNTHPFIRHIMDTNDGSLDVDILYKYMTRTEIDKEIEINQFDRVTIKRFGKDIETSVGILLVNKIVFYPLWNNKHFPYTNTVFTKKVLDYNMRLINQLVVEEKAVSSIVNDVVNMLLEFGLRFAAVFNASMTMSMMTPDKTFRKKKDDILNKAFKEYDETNDLSAVERAEHEILDYAREYYKDDDMYDIYLSGASADMDNDWKTMNVSMGPLPNLDGTKAIIVKEALGEGIPMSYTADLTNTATKGAYDRATNTALGGSLYKDIISGMGSIYAVWGDCGTKEGIETIASSKWDILNRYALVGGKSVLITLDNVDKFLNKKFIMRSPIKCKAKDGQFCSCCTGTYPFKVKSSKRVPIGMSTGEVATGILNMFMKSTHDLHISSFIIDDLNKYIYPKTTSLFEHKIDPIDGKLKVFVNEDIEWRIPNSSIDPEYNYYNVLAHGTIVTTKDKAYTIVLGTEVKTTPTAVIKPDYAEDRSLEAHTIFKYSKGDVFLLQNFAYRREMTVYKMFQLFLGGNVSNLLPVEMHLTTLNNTMKNNKKVSTSQLSLELILGSVTRDADDVTKPVRETGNKNYKFISVYELGATSSMFNSLFSGYATKAITINLAKSQKDQIKNPSPIEKAFRY